MKGVKKPIGKWGGLKDPIAQKTMCRALRSLRREVRSHFGSKSKRCRLRRS